MTNKFFYEFLIQLKLDGKLPKGFSVLNPYGDPEVRRLLRLFCDRFYKGSHPRTLVLGINPGRLGAGITGIPFTDPVALEKWCGLKNKFDKRAELSSSFVYRFIDAFGGPKLFYQSFLISSVCPLGFLQNDKNANYYDGSKLLKTLNGFMNRSLAAHMEFNIDRNNLVVFGKKNAETLKELSSFQKLNFGHLHVLEHPRFIMQYKQKELNKYVDKFVVTFKKSQP